MQEHALSLKKLLNMAAPGRVEWLNQTQAMDEVMVHWVSTDPALLGPGEALLLNAAGMTKNAWEAVRNSSAAALILVGQPNTRKKGELPTIPVACIPDQHISEANKQLLGILVDERTHLLEWGNTLHTTLSQIAAEGKGLQHLADAVTELSGRAVLLQDKSMEIIAATSPPKLHFDWPALRKMLLTRSSLPESLRDRKMAGKSVSLLTQTLTGGVGRLVTSVNVGGMARGYFSVLVPEGEANERDRVTLEQGGIILAVQMSRSKAVRETEKRIKSDLLGALLRGELSPRDMRLWRDSMGLDLEQPNVALRFSWDSEDPPSERRLETLINAEVKRLGYSVVASLLGDEIVCFCQGKSDQTRPEQAITLARSVLDRAALKFPESNPRCGIGTPAETLSVWRDSFREAGQALEMARRLAESKPLYFPDLSVYRLLLQIEGNPELTKFEEEILGPLLEYDNGAELIRTLEAYFGRNGNLKKTANSLYIHRNTLIYRLERIQEITGLDLDNADTRLALQLTLHIYRMLGRGTTKGVV